MHRKAKVIKMKNKTYLDIKIILNIISCVLGVVGSVLVIVFGGWKLLIGILIIVWGNNIMLSFKYGKGC